MQAAPDIVFDFRTKGERTFATSTGFLLALMLRGGYDYLVAAPTQFILSWLQ